MASEEEIKRLKEQIKSIREKIKRPKLILEPETLPGVRLGTKSDGKRYAVRNNRDRIFTPTEWKLFYDCLKESQQPTFLMLINTGGRINECNHVRVKDLDELKNNRMVFKITKVRARQGEKHSVPRYIKLSGQYAKKLRLHIQNNNNMLHILSQPAAHLAMKKALVKAGINEPYMFSLHSVRKTLENWLVSLGVDMKVLEFCFGHDFDTAKLHYLQTDTYTFNEKDQMKDIIGNLDRRLKGEAD